MHIIRRLKLDSHQIQNVQLGADKNDFHARIVQRHKRVKEVEVSRAIDDGV